MWVLHDISPANIVTSILFLLLRMWSLNADGRQLLKRRSSRLARAQSCSRRMWPREVSVCHTATPLPSLEYVTIQSLPISHAARRSKQLWVLAL